MLGASIVRVAGKVNLSPGRDRCDLWGVFKSYIDDPEGAELVHQRPAFTFQPTGQAVFAGDKVFENRIHVRVYIEGLEFAVRFDHANIQPVHPYYHIVER